MASLVLVGCATGSKGRSITEPVCVAINTKDLFVSKTVDPNISSSIAKRTERYILKTLNKKRVRTQTEGECTSDSAKIVVHLITLEEVAEDKGTFRKVTQSYKYNFKYEYEVFGVGGTLLAKDDDEEDDQDSLDEVLEEVGESVANWAVKKLKYAGKD